MVSADEAQEKADAYAREADNMESLIEEKPDEAVFYHDRAMGLQDLSAAYRTIVALRARLAVYESAEGPWFATVDGNLLEFATADKAQATAQAELDIHAERASTDGWDEGEVENIRWGRLVVLGKTRQTNLVSAEDDDTGICAEGGFEYRCDYELVKVMP